MNTSATILLPGLLPKRLLDKENPLGKMRCKALETLLSRAAKQPGPSSHSQAIKSFFPGLRSGAIPSGALGALAHGFISKTQTSHWCQVTPIACQIDQKAVYVLGNHELELASEEAEQLLFQLNELLQQDGLILKAASPTEWYCVVNNHHSVVMNDLLDVLYKNMAFFFPSGPDEVYWRRLLTECQMILAQHPINQVRQRFSQSPISSVWFWGLGALPQNITTVFSKVYTNASTIKGLALLANTPVAPLPERLHEEIFKGEQTLIVTDALHSFVEYQEDERWLALLQHLENNWFQPLLALLQQGLLDRLVIIFGNHQEYSVTKSQLKYFWRRVKPLVSFAN